MVSPTLAFRAGAPTSTFRLSLDAGSARLTAGLPRQSSSLILEGEWTFLAPFFVAVRMPWHHVAPDVGVARLGFGDMQLLAGARGLFDGCKRFAGGALTLDTPSGNEVRGLGNGAIRFGALAQGGLTLADIYGLQTSLLATLASAAKETSPLAADPRGRVELQSVSGASVFLFRRLSLGALVQVSTASNAGPWSFVATGGPSVDFAPVDGLQFYARALFPFAGISDAAWRATVGVSVWRTLP